MVITIPSRLKQFAGTIQAKDFFWIRLACFAFLASLFLWPLLSHASDINAFVMLNLSSYERDAVITMRRFFELPLWDPYYCGGIYALGSPQSRFASPSFLISLIFGQERGALLIAFVLLIVGMEGCFRYLRSIHHNSWSALLCAPLFPLSGFFASLFFLGWINFFSFLAIPWLLWGVRQSVHSKSAGLVSIALSAAWMTGFGGTYSVPMAALAAVFECFVVLASLRKSPKRLRELLVSYLIAGMLSVFLSCYRLWPIIESLHAAPRIMTGTPAHSLRTLGAMLFERLAPEQGNLSVHGQYYIGIALIPLIVLGSFRRSMLPYVAALGLSLWTATGYASQLSPFAALRHLPIFSTFRYPERYLIFVALYATILCAEALHRLFQLAQRKRALHPILLGALLLLFTTYSLMISDHVHAVAGMHFEHAPKTIERSFHQASGSRWALSYFAPMSRGSLLLGSLSSSAISPLTC
ncbi:MAG: hypothetical protein IPJ88_18090 [Myxococcales bacterium]|nr:MAG: hypothetical protein IPJ88_18090 [Myxococcales bacterium]